MAYHNNNNNNNNNQWREPGQGSVPEEDYYDYDYNSHHDHCYGRGDMRDQEHLERYLEESQSQRGPFRGDMTASAEKGTQHHKEEMKKKLKAIGKELKPKKPTKKNNKTGPKHGYQKAKTTTKPR